MKETIELKALMELAREGIISIPDAATRLAIGIDEVEKLLKSFE